MKKFKNLFILTMVIWGLTAFSQKIHADTNDLSAEQVMSTINSRGSKVIYHTRRSATLSGLTNTIIYNDGIYCGQLYLQSWSYDKDFATGRFWYVGIYRGTVKSNGGCPIGRLKS